jgi:hypothetical protein
MHARSIVLPHTPHLRVLGLDKHIHAPWLARVSPRRRRLISGCVLARMLLLLVLCLIPRLLNGRVR